MTRRVCTRDCCALDDKASMTALEAAYLKLPRHDGPAKGRTHPRCSLVVARWSCGKGYTSDFGSSEGGMLWRIEFGSSTVRHEATVGEPPVRWTCCWRSTSSRSARSRSFPRRAVASRSRSTGNSSSRSSSRSAFPRRASCSTWSANGSVRASGTSVQDTGGAIDRPGAGGR